MLIIIIKNFIKISQNLGKQLYCCCFGSKFSKKWPIYTSKMYLKIYVYHFCLVMVPHYHAQNISNHMKWFILPVISSRMDGSPHPLTPKPFKRKINFNYPLRRKIWKFKKGVEVWSMVPGQVLSKGGGGGWGACNFSR